MMMIALSNKYSPHASIHVRAYMYGSGGGFLRVHASYIPVVVCF